MNEYLNKKLLHQDFSIGKIPGLDSYLEIAAGYAMTENAIAVLSDLKANRSHIFYGGFGEFLGIAEKGTYRCIDSIWEEEILCRIPREDLEQKQLDELQFFDFVRHREKAGNNYMMNMMSMFGADGSSMNVLHRIFYFSDGMAVRYALCLYTPASAEIRSAIVDSVTGETTPLEQIDTAGMLSEREKEVLRLIDEGRSSKEIASHMNISIHTVSRHRQNILEKLRARNSAHACKMAKGLKVI